MTYQPPAYTPSCPRRPIRRARERARALPGPGPAVAAGLCAAALQPLWRPPPLPEQAAVPASQKVADASAVTRRTGEGSKLYSMHRAYGLEPDAIPQVEGGDRYVFIGPPDPPVKKTDDNDDDSKADDGRPF
uniref:Uncharacterized protein n=1 Tax=Phenylobacterium glaciei TaxID=2803784 RepID=A0A974P2R5_9CAUL|nr:hypothetical protein JKL49_22485 [Phenylobacterium glaciei]